MDEDQVNEEQGSNPERQEVTFKQAEQDETPSRGMFSAVRKADPVNLYSFSKEMILLQTHRFFQMLICHLNSMSASNRYVERTIPGQCYIFINVTFLSTKSHFII